MTAHTDTRAKEALILEALVRIRAARREIANAETMIDYAIGEASEQLTEVALNDAPSL